MTSACYGAAGAFDPAADISQRSQAVGMETAYKRLVPRQPLGGWCDTDIGLHIHPFPVGGNTGLCLSTIHGSIEGLDP